MHYLIAWSGFLGAWLLVAGPVYQAAIELNEEGFERDELTAVSAEVPPADHPSAWWWLLPPVAYVRHRRAIRAHRRALLDALPTDQRERVVRFSNKATGWLFVASGAFFIAVKETWELVELNEWSVGLFWVMIVLMVLLATVNTVLRMRRAQALVGPTR